MSKQKFIKQINQTTGLKIGEKGLLTTKDAKELAEYVENTAKKLDEAKSKSEGIIRRIFRKWW